MTWFRPRHPSDLAARTVIAVLGMHRSGTSAVTGMLQDYGVELGPVSERNRFNVRGNRELPALNRLHEKILERCGGSWWDPPAAAGVRRGDLRARNRILRSIRGSTIAVKDPRMLMVWPLWDDLKLCSIGVIRNPVAVCESLERRAAVRRAMRPEQSRAQWESLWRRHNAALLELHTRRPFPIINFDDGRGLDARLRAALAVYGINASGESRFYDQTLLHGARDDWRSQVGSPESLALWDRLAAISS